MRLSTVDDKYGQIYEYFETKRQDREFNVFSEQFHEDGMESVKVPRAGGAAGLKDYLEQYVTEEGWRRCLAYLRQKKNDSARISIPGDVKERLDELRGEDQTYGDLLDELLTTAGH